MTDPAPELDDAVRRAEAAALWRWCVCGHGPAGHGVDGACLDATCTCVAYDPAPSEETST